MHNKSGFTLIELVMVILLLGILAVYATPRLDLSLFRQTSFFIQALSTIRYAQKQAIASGCNIQVNIDATATPCRLSWSNPGNTDTNCSNDGIPVNNPANNNADFCDGSTASANPTGGSFRFDNIGRPMNNADMLLTTAQDIVIGDRTIRVEAETGYTHEN